ATTCRGISAPPHFPCSLEAAALPRLRLEPTQSRSRARGQPGRGGPRSSLRCPALLRVAVEPGLRRRETRKAWNRCGEIDRLPFRIEAGPLQRVEPREQMLNKACDAIITVRARRPIEGDQRGGHRNRLHVLALLDQIGIIGGIESGGEIVVFELV